MNNVTTTSRKLFDNLSSNGKYQCPDCGCSNTTPRGGCHCPMAIGGFTRHINAYHHDCKLAVQDMRECGPQGWRSTRFTRLPPQEEDKKRID